jgi:glycerophosphoryl diester phosphodiesterase
MDCGIGLKELMRFLLALILSMLTGLGCGDSDHSATATSVFESDGFLNIAHRGGARLAPEHTLVAYRNGLEAGADVIELDLHATADGVVVAMHDDSVDRTTDGTGLIKEMTFAQLRQLDAGYRFSTDRGVTFPWRGKGLKVPTLDEALDLLGDTPLSVEFKQRTPSIVELVLASFAAHGGVGDVVFAAFPPEPIEEVRRLAPGARTAFTTRELAAFSLITPAMLESYRPPSGFIQPPKELIDPTFLARAHDFGLKVHAWTVNDRDEMCQLMQLGVDGLFSDDPAMLEAVRHDDACAP